MARQSREQKSTVARVMHEYRHGELESSRGGRVRNPRQAIAIGLSEAGASNQRSRGENRRQYAHTKGKERRGQTAQREKEGRRATDRSASRRRAAPRSRGDGSQSRSGEKTRAQLYKEAQKRKIPGRSGMSKAQLQRALSR
ncbi:MAG TPA: DUF6496 domain-containing protein [Acetobacteraceae bacterium]|nr:DUF6496 domain-containing protein [Acetobacteraceae bacterium]